MRSVTNTATTSASETCDPRQHTRDEQAFVEMIVVCAVVWFAWRAFQFWRDRSGMPKFRRRPPGA